MTATTAATDAAYDQLARRNAELEQEKAALVDVLERTEKERDDLLGEIERLHAVIEPFARAWLHREPKGEPGSKGYQRRLERSLLPFYSCGDDSEPLTGAHLRDAALALSASGIDMESES
ncbi:hypothetical protein RSO41_06180 [Halomonas sp. I1]|uniref:hypothetical protein n=1 Tax=Halomonas sp. I1 TaxID=393536 RepID=UPI0028E073D6|nr:hypothetical protein [Halomonas sp. I1]MDT8894238.1 hypothetical protein [Halomonas sp. I1]